VSAEVVQLVEQAGPYLTTAVGAYGVAEDEGAELRVELARLLPAAGETVHVTASGERSIAAKTIGTAVTGDNATIRP
jgi:hypothetical protein